MFDENGQLLYPANCKMPSPNNVQLGSMVLHRELDLFYDTPVVLVVQNLKG